MVNITRSKRKALQFWATKIKEGNFVLKKDAFPNAYTRKILEREGLLYNVKRGLYLLKSKSDDTENLLYHFYWEIVESILADYKPWSVEKENALALHLGDESLPQVLQIRTLKKTNYTLTLYNGLKIHISYDPHFHVKTRQIYPIEKNQIFIDIPEKVLFSIKKREGTKFISFLRGMAFSPPTLEILYSQYPKPVVTKGLICLCHKIGRETLAKTLTSLLKKYTIYTL